MEPFALPDRYRLEGGIAAGGMAAVYAAHDTVLDRPVAVKVLADHLNDDETARRRFEREARAAAALSNHPGVVTIFDVGEFNGRAFIVMERRDGGTIAQAGRVEPERALQWLATVAEALDAAHERGVIHRDIKPGNLLLDDRGAVAVADFGIASIASESERFTQTGQVLGTAAYLSPEQACGEPATSASDRYALAVVAYELLTGEKPYTTANFAAQARAHIEEPPPDAPGLPRAAQDALKRGLAKDPGDRWPTSRAFVDALSKAMDGPSASPPPTATRKTRPLPATPTAGAAPAAAAGAPRPRRTGTILSLGALVLVVIAVAAIALGGGSDDGSSADKSASQPKAAKSDNAKTAQQTPEETATPAPATPEPTATEAPPEETVAPATAGDPASLNAQGFELFQAGDYAEAIPVLEQAVEACGDSEALDPCGYALYNLGASYNRSGDPKTATKLLKERLKRFGDNSAGEVQAELDAAEQARKDKD